tara:strand:+ start:978 stop:1115 length:138 start_codon:yes stop_codon:yes gene_type:complete
VVGNKISKKQRKYEHSFSLEKKLNKIEHFGTIPRSALKPVTIILI